MTIFAAINTAPNYDAGIETGDSTWRVALELYDYRSENWIDLTPAMTGVEWTQGKAPAGQGYPSRSIGVLNFTLSSKTNTYQPWLVGANSFNFNLRPNYGIVRLAMFQPGASTTYSVLSNGFTSVTRTNWKPLFTGYVESWDTEIDMAGWYTNTATITETMASLALIENPAVTAVGSTDTCLQRVQRLCNAASWQFGYTDSLQYTGTIYYTDAGWTLQTTTMSANRLQEVFLTGESIYNTVLSSNGDGSIKFGVGPDVSYGGTYGTTPNQIIRFQSKTTNLVAADSTNMPLAVTAYYEAPLVITNNTEAVINSVELNSVGGAVYTSTSLASIALYGLRTYRRGDYIVYDIAADKSSLNATNLLTTYDCYSDTFNAIDQTIQPGVITIANQQAAQRAIDVHAPCVVDYSSADSTQKVRFVGRMTQVKNTIIPLGSPTTTTHTASAAIVGSALVGSAQVGRSTSHTSGTSIYWKTTVSVLSTTVIPVP